MKTPEEFWSRVDRRESDRCWGWTGAKNSTGYGTVLWQGRVSSAHRVAAFLSGLVLDVAAPANRRGSGFVLHSCDNRACCNPAHFRVGTYAMNQGEAYSRRRRAGRRGQDHVNSKLTAIQAETIPSRWRQGERQVALALEFGVSQVTISLVCRGKTYR